MRKLISLFVLFINVMCVRLKSFTQACGLWADSSGVVKCQQRARCTLHSQARCTHT